MENDNSTLFRSIPGAVSYMKAKDPDCAVSEWAITSAIKENKIPHRKVGRKTIVNVKTLEEYFNGIEPTQIDRTFEDNSERDERKMGEFF